MIEEKLPDITEFARIYQGVEPITEPVPIQPTAHYAMGGIPTDLHARVIRDADRTIVPGLYAAGECACVSVHGANRLGTNSLVDLLVFGRRAGRQMARDVRGLELPDLARDAIEPVRAELRAISERPSGESAARIRADLADVMMDNVGVYRTEELLAAALPRVRALQERYGRVHVDDKGTVFNTDLLEAREVGYLLDCAETTVVSGPGPQGEPRRPRPRGLPRARRRELPEPHAGLPGRGRAAAGLQAGHDHPFRTEAANVLA